MSKLKKLFDECPWANKLENQKPESEKDLLYIWREHEYKFAAPFFGNSGEKLLCEDDHCVTRTLYYWEDEKGIPTLSVTQSSKPVDMEEVGRKMGMVFDAEKVNESLERIMGLRYGEKK